MSDVYEYKAPKTRSNHVGIEIECVTDTEWEYLGEDFNDLSKWVRVMEDGSINDDRENGEYACEVTICASEQSFRKVVGRVCDRLREHSAGVDKSCGLHVHLDMRNRDVAVCYNNLIIAQPLLYGMQPPSRQRNSYCQPTHQGTTFEQATNAHGRYSGINSAAFKKHTTLEVRMHAGTTDPIKIVKWVELLLAIVRHPKVSHILEFEFSREVSDYITERTNKFNKEVVDEAA